MKFYEPTAILILIFAILLSRASESEADPYVEVGGLFGTAEASMAGIGYLYQDKWDASLSYIGEGKDDWGADTPKVKVMSIKRLFHPGWFRNKYFMGVGIAKLESKYKNNLVSVYNFELALGFKLGNRTRLYLKHFSSFGVTEPNTGLNALTLRIDL